jgi:hypothetical protein
MLSQDKPSTPLGAASSFRPEVGIDCCMPASHRQQDRMEMSAFDDRYWNLAQVAVWVIYREKALVEQFANPERDAYIAIERYPKNWPAECNKKGSQQELQRALGDGRLNAQGYKRSGPEHLVDIPPADWNNLILDPPAAYLRDPDSKRLEPWFGFVIDSADVKKLWRSEFETSGRTKFDWAAIRAIHDKAKAQNPRMSQNDLVVEIQGEYEERLNKNAPSRTSIQRHMKSWT